MKQKLAIACGLLHAPRVIYFDEPLTGLDPIGIRRMKDSILKRARDGAAIIISSHLLHLVEEICSHILILKEGRKIIHGTLGEITQKFSAEAGDASLEEVFFRATEGARNAAAPEAPPPRNEARSQPISIRRHDLRPPLSPVSLDQEPHGDAHQAAQAAQVSARRRGRRPLLLLVFLPHASSPRPTRGQALALFASPDNQVLFESVGALALFIILLLAWIIPHQRAALTFTEAEVAFLFPAPISRRTLIHFKLLRSQTAILFTTLLLTLVTNRLGGHAGFAPRAPG